MQAISNLQSTLLSWYRENLRPLPWRESRDPYRIWISEIMLQQTTVVAVIPYFERFLRHFPNLQALALADQNEVLSLWSGLGYYSRARNLHKAAQCLVQNDFPQTFQQLIELPGFGPYTARAVSSLAFDQPVGVLDGNVIRVLCRLYNRDLDWWTTKGRTYLQEKSDQLVQGASSAEVNQALMELGATICTPQSPACPLCPWRKSCQSLQKQTIAERPKPKPRRAMELWLWQPYLLEKKRQNKVALVENTYAPFLKKQWIFPGRVRKLQTAPKSFAFSHHITHHQIFVKPQTPAIKPDGSWKKNLAWAAKDQLHEWNPSSLLKKVLAERPSTK